MKSSQDWITEIDFTIESLKIRNRRYYYGFSLEMNKEVAKAVQNYFEGVGYKVEAKQCPLKLYDFVIEFPV